MNENDLRKFMKLLRDRSGLSDQEFLALERATTLPDPETLTPWALMVFWGPKLVKALRAQWKRNTHLHRRCQAAESAAREKIRTNQQAGFSLGRSLLHFYVRQLQEEIRTLRGEVPKEPTQ